MSVSGSRECGVGFFFIVLVVCLAFLTVPLWAAEEHEPKWIRVSSLHFAVLSDAEEKKAVEVVLRLEQMRGVCGQLLLRNKLSMPEPVDVVALRSYSEYARLAPPALASSAQGYFLSGDDRNYIVLNVADEDSWLAVRRQLAVLYLSYNYPPTQAWLDEGFAAYFSSVRVDNQQATMGGDPGGLIELLKAQSWTALPALFGMRTEAAARLAGPQRTLFTAEAWIVTHYLLAQNKLPETGTYFGLVQNQGLPIEQAVQQAYGMSAAQLEQAVKEHLHSLTMAPAAAERAGKTPILAAGEMQVPVPVGPADVGTSTVQVPRAEAQALLAEVAVRVPEHREEAMHQLDTLVEQPLTETVIAHRALGWALVAQNKFEDAMDEFHQALELSQTDPWTHYYLARTKYLMAQRGGEMFPGLANMMQDLRIVLDWDGNFAEAYHMLAMARVQGGGINSALSALRTAISLNPRNEGYLLDLARVYMAGKRWDEATELLQRLKTSTDPQIAGAATQNLDDLPTLKRYGLMPQHPNAAAAGAPGGSHPASATANADSDEESEGARLEPPPDKRKVQFLKGRLMSVNCAQAPAAILTVSEGGRTMRLRTEDVKSLLLIGADEFSCDWKNRPVVANYKAGGKSDGDLVSLEVQ